MPLLNRRDWLKAMAAGSAAALFPFGNRVSALAGETLGSAEPMDGPSPLWLLSPLRPGSVVGNGYRFESLSQVQRGAAVLTLTSDTGETARVHLCRKGAVARGIAHSRHLDFVLMNGSDGKTPSNEGLGVVLLSIAKRVARNERRASEQLASLDGLESHDQRVRRYGGETLA